MRNYDDWKLDTPDNDLEVHTECDFCSNDIYIDQEFYSTDIGNFCDPNCFFKYAKEYHRATYLARHK